MPIYEYRCTDCGYQNEYLQKVSEPLMKVCPTCGKETFAKLLSAAGFQLKGSGWYATDFKSSGARPAEKTAQAKSDAKPAEKAAAVKPDAKPEAAPVKSQGGRTVCVEPASS